MSPSTAGEAVRIAALKRETSLIVSKSADERTVSRLMDAQRRYDAGADSYEAFGVPAS